MLMKSHLIFLHLHNLLLQIVHVLYQENDWVYVISESNSEGFIPHSYCAQFGSQASYIDLSKMSLVIVNGLTNLVSRWRNWR